MFMYTNMTMTKLQVAITAFALYQQAVAFQPVAVPQHARTSLKYSSAAASLERADLGSPSDMLSISAMQQELRERGIQFSPSMDRKTLTRRVKEARKRNILYTPPPVTAETSDASSSASEGEEADLTRLRTMSIRDLREECNARQIRWGTLIEKEDLVQAIWKDTHGILPACVTELTGEELDTFSDLETLILLDVYAEYCGPCKLMAAQLEAAAEDLGDKCKVCKLDSEKFPEWASKYDVRALPTVLVLKKGQIINRLEGAFPKDKIIEAVEPYVL